MASTRDAIPPINWAIQEKYATEISMKDPKTGKEVIYYSTPLRWLFTNLETTLFVETLTEADAETASDPEACCPVCLEDYKKPGEEIITPESEQASERHERPLKLECGHIFGANCLHQVFDPQVLARPRCPFCRHEIDPFLKDIPLTCKGNNMPWDIAGIICCAIRIFLISNPSEPETPKRLKEWVLGPAFDTKRPTRIEICAAYRDSIKKWDEWGDKRMWKYIEARRKGGCSM